MPYGSRFDASRTQWRVLVVGPGHHAPHLTATLHALDSKVSVDRAETSETAERCLASTIHYDAAFVLDTVELGDGETTTDLEARLSVGRTPPPLLAVTTTPRSAVAASLESFIPVAVEAETLNLRRLISALRTARELHRAARLEKLLDDLDTSLVPDARGQVPLQSALDALTDAIDVQGAHLMLASDVDGIRWEVATGESFDPDDHPSYHRAVSATFSPFLAVRRSTPSLSAALLLGPLSASSQSRVRGGLVAFVDLMLERVELASDQRATERAGIVNDLFEDADLEPPADDVATNTPAARPPVESTTIAGQRRQLLSESLPALRPPAIDALLVNDLRIVHQPIEDTAGVVVASNMLLGVPRSPTTAESRAEVVDLAPLDSLDADTVAALTATVTVPAGRWLIEAAIPTLRRLVLEGELEAEHRVHLALLHRQLAAGGTVELIEERLRRHDIAPRSIAIDVAEPTLVEHHDTISAMARLADLGVALFLDGFGGAGSNFTLLRTSLVSGVKLSRNVVRGVSADDRQASIVSGLIGLCDELGLEIIAQGVDQRADHTWLTQYPHVRLQGALIGPAMTEAELHGDSVAQAS